MFTVKPGDVLRHKNGVCWKINKVTGVRIEFTYLFHSTGEVIGSKGSYSNYRDIWVQSEFTKVHNFKDYLKQAEQCIE